MTKPLIIFFVAAAAVGCNNAAPVQSPNANSEAPVRAEKLQTTTAHTTENEPQKMPETNPAASNSKWSQGGEAISTAKFDGVIAAGEKSVKAKPSDEAAKKVLAMAYFDRGMALTGARQYASALGDYRRALKNDPNYAEAQQWVDQITSIYGMLKKEAPKEGEEPPPLPWSGEKDK